MSSKDQVAALPAEIAKKSLSRQQEKDLSEIILSGKDSNFEARNELIESNLRLVRKIAQDYTRMGMSMNELISSGQIGLMVAATKFDGRYPAKFSSFAQWWIRRSIREDLLKRSNILSVSASTLRRARRMSVVAGLFESTHGRTPSCDELAKASKETPRRVRCLSDICKCSISSLEHNLEMGHEVAAERGERIGDAETVKRLHACVQRLPEKEKAIVDGRFGLSGHKQTLKAIGRKLKLSSERVRQIETMAIGKLKAMMEAGEQ